MDKNTETIKEITKKVLAIMGFAAEVEVVDEDGGTVARINSIEAGFLIGQGGENLFALQHLIRLMTTKELKEEKVNFSLDINDYRKHQVEILKDFVLEKANRVAQEMKSFSFQPMSSFERRVAHLTLQGRQDVVCESEGEGEERHIVIRPAS